MAAFPHRIIRAVAKRIIASPEFRYGDTCFIASIVAKPTDKSISVLPRASTKALGAITRRLGATAMSASHPEVAVA
jgi:hypothetical protein